MPYTFKFILYLLACLFLAMIAGSLLAPLGEVFNTAFAVALAVFAIFFGRWLFGRKNL